MTLEWEVFEETLHLADEEGATLAEQSFVRYSII